MPKHSNGGSARRWRDARDAASHDAAWTAEEFRFGAFVLRTDRRELRCEDIVRPMERRCFDLLVYLLRHAGRVVSKEELLDNVWSNRFVTMSVIAQSVLKVRKALRLADGTDGPLRTVHRVGYRVVGEVLHRRIEPAELQAPSGAKAWSWEEPRLRNMPGAPAWLPSALGAFGAWALNSHGIAIHGTPPERGPLRPPEARCEVAPGPQGFDACLDLLIEPSSPVRLRASSSSPFQAVWRAAESAAWLVRLQDMLASPSDASEDMRWERLASLSHATPPTLGDGGPTLSSVWTMPLVQSTPAQQADLVMEAAWRGDPAALSQALQLRDQAHATGDSDTESWADLAAAQAEWHRGDTRGVAARVQRAMARLARPHWPVRAQRAAAVAAHLLCATQSVVDTPDWWRQALLSRDVVPTSAARRWWLLSQLEHRLSGGEVVELAGIERLDASIDALVATDGLQALLLNLCGMLRAEDGELNLAWQRMKRAYELAQRCGWTGIRPLCLLTLGDLSARLGEHPTLDACVATLGADPARDEPRPQAVLAWLQARRLALHAQHANALPLIEKAWPALSQAGIWFRDDAWLFAIDTALQARSRHALMHWRGLLQAPEGPTGRSRTALLTAVNASLALLEGDPVRAQALMVSAWRGAPPSTAKRLLAMAAASAARWLSTPQPEVCEQALLHAGAWLKLSPAGRRLRQVLGDRPGEATAARAGASQSVGESDADAFWVWAA